MKITSPPPKFLPSRKPVLTGAGAVLLVAVGFLSMLLTTARPVWAADTYGPFSGFSRHLDRGGKIAQYRADITKAFGRHVISGDCMSACTLWLSYRRSCVEPDAKLWFHAASRGMVGNPWRDMDPAASEDVLGSYPPQLRAFLRARGWMERPDYNTLSGTELAALGVPLCRSRTVD